MLAYIAAIICMGAAYSIITLGFNLQWGYTGLFNLSVFGLAAAGGYTSVILTSQPAMGRIGGFGMPFIIGLIGAAIVAGIIGGLIGLATLHLEFGFFAISTLGLGMTIQTLLRNEQWLSNGVWGIGGINKPLSGLLGSGLSNWSYGILALIIMLIIYFLLERIVKSPWGRIQMAIKEDENLTEMLGKDVFFYRIQSLILGSMIMGIGGAVFAHYQGYINPDSYTDIMMCFLPLLMVVAGGTGNNKGSIVGAFVIWSAWSLSELFAGYLPISSTKIPHIRTLVVGLIIIAILRWRPTGLIGRKMAVSSSSTSRKIGPAQNL